MGNNISYAEKVCYNINITEWENTNISIKGVTGNKEKITKQKENVEIMIHNKIVTIGKVYQYNNIECDIILGNDFL